MSQLSSMAYVNQVPQLVTFLVVVKSHWNKSYRIVAFDGQQLVDIKMSPDYMDIIKPGKAYQFQLVNPWDPTIVAAQSLDVLGAPTPDEMVLHGMLCALGRMACNSFRNIYPNIGNETYLDVGISPQTPRVFFVTGNLIKKQKVDDKSRCSIITDVGEKDLRYTGSGSDSYNGLPDVYDPNLGLRQYTLILVVADPLSNPSSWIGTRNYILVVAIY